MRRLWVDAAVQLQVDAVRQLRVHELQLRQGEARLRHQSEEHSRHVLVPRVAHRRLRQHEVCRQRWRERTDSLNQEKVRDRSKERLSKMSVS